jgi:FkbM family methyltransferase
MMKKQLPTEYVNTRREYIIFKNDCGVTDHVRNGTVYESHIFQYIQNNLNVAGTTIIDIGGNLGFHTLEFADMVGPDGEVFSFEPQKLIYYQLCGNVILNGFKNVTTYNVALSDENTTLKMENLQYTSEKTINIGNAHLNAWTHSGYNLVEVKKLDDYTFHKPVSIIKIDVQGHEPNVLDGAINTINIHRPIIFVEIEQDQLSIYGKNEEDVVSRLRNLNYELRKLGVVDYAALPV